MAGAARRSTEVTINIRARQRQRDLIDTAAETLGKTRSEFMLETACQAAQDVLLDRRLFVIDAAAYAEFNALLAAPAQPAAALRRLLAAKAPWE